MKHLVKLHLDLPNHWMFKGESIWAISLGDDLDEINNVPFCAYGPAATLSVLPPTPRN